MSDSEPGRKMLVAVLRGLAAKDRQGQMRAGTLLAQHDHEVWRAALAAQGDRLLRSLWGRMGFPSDVIPAITLALLFLLYLTWVHGFGGAPAIFGPGLALIVAHVLLGYRAANPSEVEALLGRIGDDPRLVPLLLAHLPKWDSMADISTSVRAVWMRRLSRLLPEWHLQETPLPSAAGVALRRELRHYAGRNYLSELEAQFLMALLVSVDREMAGEGMVRYSLIGNLERLEELSVHTWVHDPERLAEGARQAIRRVCR